MPEIAVLVWCPFYVQSLNDWLVLTGVLYKVVSLAPGHTAVLVLRYREVLPVIAIPFHQLGNPQNKTNLKTKRKNQSQYREVCHSLK